MKALGKQNAQGLHIIDARKLLLCPNLSRPVILSKDFVKHLFLKRPSDMSSVEVQACYVVSV